MERTPQSRSATPAPMLRRPLTLNFFANNQKLDIRAHQRTYEGAYLRLAIGALLFLILILKLFSKEFLPVGTVYTCYGTLLFAIGVHRANHVDVYYLPLEDATLFHTAGGTVWLLTVISLASYVTLLVLVARL